MGNILTFAVVMVVCVYTEERTPQLTRSSAVSRRA